MSLSQPKLTNPCHKFIEFKASTEVGHFQYWVKGEEKGQGKNVILPIPFTFIVLDELSTITGFSDEHQCGIFSNEVRNLNEETLNVRAFKGKGRLVGKYADIKGDIAGMGGKYTKSVYAALIGKDNTLELVNFQLKGIAFKAFLDSTIDKSSFGVSVTGCDDGKKGSVKYKVPIYKSTELPKGMIEKATAMDKALQVYLREYTHQQTEKAEAVQADVPVESQEDSNIPF